MAEAHPPRGRPVGRGPRAATTQPLTPASPGVGARQSRGCLSAHSMLETAWHLLSNGALYQDPGADYFERRHDPAIEAKRLQRRIEALSASWSPSPRRPRKHTPRQHHLVTHRPVPRDTRPNMHRDGSAFHRRSRKVTPTKDVIFGGFHFGPLTWAFGGGDIVCLWMFAPLIERSPWYSPLRNAAARASGCSLASQSP